MSRSVEVIEAEIAWAKKRLDAANSAHATAREKLGAARDAARHANAAWIALEDKADAAVQAAIDATDRIFKLRAELQTAQAKEPTP
jgi:hypothetical protein